MQGVATDVAEKLLQTQLLSSHSAPEWHQLPQVGQVSQCCLKRFVVQRLSVTLTACLTGQPAASSVCQKCIRGQGRPRTVLLVRRPFQLEVSPALQCNAEHGVLDYACVAESAKSDAAFAPALSVMHPPCMLVAPDKQSQPTTPG